MISVNSGPSTSGRLSARHWPGLDSGGTMKQTKSKPTRASSSSPRDHSVAQAPVDRATRRRAGRPDARRSRAAISPPPRRLIRINYSARNRVASIGRRGEIDLGDEQTLVTVRLIRESVLRARRSPTWSAIPRSRTGREVDGVLGRATQRPSRGTFAGSANRVGTKPPSASCRCGWNTTWRRPRRRTVSNASPGNHDAESQRAGLEHAALADGAGAYVPSSDGSIWTLS